MPDRKGFTLIELLVVVAVIVLLLSLMSPTFRRVFALGDRDRCMFNVHQLSIAWTIYPVNNNGTLVGGWTGGGGWALYGDETPANSARSALITNGALYPYTQNVNIYRCPADPVNHIRSYSITSLMNGNDWGSLPYVSRYFGINDPAGQMVFVEEHDCRAWSNMGSWAQDPKYWNTNHWVDYVANFHDGGDHVGFADGHSEYWMWQDPKTLQASANNQFYYPDNGNIDLARIRQAFYNGIPGAY